MSLDAAVVAHYGKGDLLQRIDAALRYELLIFLLGGGVFFA